MLALDDTVDQLRSEIFEVHPGHPGVLEHVGGRELLVNAARHAETDEVSLMLQRRGDCLTLSVSDDGRGMSEPERANAQRRGHIGLASLRERVDALGGSLEIISAPGQGTHVGVRLPL